MLTNSLEMYEKISYRMEKCNSRVKKARLSGMCDHKHLEERVLGAKVEAWKKNKTDGKRLMFNTEEAFRNVKCTMVYEKLMSTENAIP